MNYEGRSMNLLGAVSARAVRVTGRAASFSGTDTSFDAVFPCKLRSCPDSDAASHSKHDGCIPSQISLQRKLHLRIVSRKSLASDKCSPTPPHQTPSQLANLTQRKSNKKTTPASMTRRNMLRNKLQPSHTKYNTN